MARDFRVNEFGKVGICIWAHGMKAGIELRLTESYRIAIQEIIMQKIKKRRKGHDTSCEETLRHGVQHVDIMISLNQLPILRSMWSPETLASIDVHWISHLADSP